MLLSQENMIWHARALDMGSRVGIHVLNQLNSLFRKPEVACSIFPTVTWCFLGKSVSTCACLFQVLIYGDCSFPPSMDRFENARRA